VIVVVRLLARIVGGSRRLRWWSRLRAFGAVVLLAPEELVEETHSRLPSIG
jgi:hypothetical protein